MRNGRSTRFGRWILIPIAVVLIPSASCNAVHRLVASFRSTSHFVPFGPDPRVMYEPGGKDFAAKVAARLPNAVEKVETLQYLPFREPIQVYACASRDSFYKLSGTRARAAVTDKLLLSPELGKDPQALSRLLTHELSHLHLLQHVGLRAFIRLPSWFKEGLATWASGGGGASRVTETQALASIREGHSFVPDAGRGLIASFLFPHYASHWHLAPHMYYRQCMTFVAFLRRGREERFRNLLIAVLSGKPFRQSFRAAYGKTPPELWDQFLHEIRRVGPQTLVVGQAGKPSREPDNRPEGLP